MQSRRDQGSSTSRGDDSMTWTEDTRKAFDEVFKTESGRTVLEFWKDAENRIQTAIESGGHAGRCQLWNVHEDIPPTDARCDCGWAPVLKALLGVA